jgi:hypothetical protein
MKTKHTPGPWSLYYYAGEVKLRIKGANDEQVANNLKIKPANAQLIVAAPEMLEALELTLEALFQNPELNFCKGPLDIELFEAISAIKYAIRKAKGEL